MEIETEHYELARRVVRRWREGGYDHLVVVRRSARAERCYPCRQQDVPAGAVASWDYYPMPTSDRLGDGDASGRPPSRAELWVAATIAYGSHYDSAERNA